MSDSLWLASGSPRRKELLERAGLRFTVRSLEVDETLPPGPIAEAIEAVAARKAHAVAATLPAGWVLAADTLVILDGRPLGKPDDDAAARAMLSELSGREHQVITGVSLQRIGGETRRDHAVTHVRFHPLSDDTIEGYVASGEPFGKAGAYAIQGGAASFVAERRGSWSNVVGLPMVLVQRLLTEVGCPAGEWHEPV